jgi:regulator of ribonuclease activity B
MKYPDDANGDALRRMEAVGDDLTRPRNVEFTVVFPNENSATQFADHVRTLGYSAAVELTETIEGFPWDVIVVRQMIPSHEAIGACEESLKRVAETYGGHNNGWGCLSSP